MYRKEHELENDNFLYTLLDKRFFAGFREPISSPLKKGCQLELFITDVCNLKCTYCYLQKYGKQLYPHNGNNVEEIVKNLNMLLQHYLDECYSFYNIDLFSGEIWGDKLGNMVMDTLLMYIKKGIPINNITIPTNFSFLLDDQKKEKVEYYINAFKEHGTLIVLSASVDGKMLEDKTRPFKVKKLDGTERIRDDVFYNDLFAFCNKYNFHFHPMVSAYGIENWIENYKWYKQEVGVYHPENPASRIMMLEVRNDDWTQDKIKEYLNFLDYLIKDKLNDLDNDIVAYTKFLFNIEQKNSSGYIPFALPLAENCMPCTIQEQLTVRLGDLALVGCHRMAYDQFVYGHYSVEDDKIVGLKANNPQVAAKVILCNPMNSIHKCDRCKYKKICMKGCFGSQYEATNELFMPIDSVCDLLKAKYTFLLNKYQEMGVLEIANQLLQQGLEYYNIKEPYDTYIQILQTEDDETCQN